MTDEQSLRLDEGDDDERALLRGVVSANRAVSSGVGRIGGVGLDRVKENAERLQKQRAAGAELQQLVVEKRLAGVEELLLLLRYLPENFVTQYLRLIDSAVGEKNLGSGRGYDENDLRLGKRSGVQVKSEQKDHRGGANASAGGKSSGAVSRMPIRNEDRLLDLQNMQKRLRGVARDIQAMMAAVDGETRPVTRRRCVGRCKRLGSYLDLFCSNCGGRMEDVVKK